jgi:hypothetical protein
MAKISCEGVKMHLLDALNVKIRDSKIRQHVKNARSDTSVIVVVKIVGAENATVFQIGQEWNFAKVATNTYAMIAKMVTIN